MYRQIIVIWFSFLTELLCSSNSVAQPYVIYDNGNTASITPLYRVLVGPGPPPAVRYSGPLTIGVAQQVPYTTPNMTPGPVKSYKRSLNRYHSNIRPMFLLGTDRLSRQWLLRNRHILVQKGVVGILVEASSEDQVEEIRRLATGLEINCMSAYEIARNLKLKHYPVLITQDYIEQ